MDAIMENIIIFDIKHMKNIFKLSKLLNKIHSDDIRFKYVYTEDSTSVIPNGLKFKSKEIATEVKLKYF